MRTLKKFVALGLGIAITFSGSGFMYGYFTDMAQQQNTINFDTKPVVLGVDISDCEYVGENGKHVMKFKFLLNHNSNIEHRDIYEGETIDLDITSDSHNVFKGATASIEFINESEGWIKISKDSLWWLAGQSRTVGLTASIEGLDGITRNLWPSARYFKIKRIALDNIKITEITKSELDIDPEVLNDPVVVESPKEEIPNNPEVVEPPKEEMEVPSEPDIVEPPKEDVEVPSEPDVVEPPKEEVEVPSEPEVVEPPKEEVEEPREPDILGDANVGEVNE